MLKISAENFIRKNFKNYELCGVSYEFYAKENEEIILDKFIAYSTSLDMNCEKLHGFIKAILSYAEEQGYIEAERELKEYVEEDMKDIIFGIQKCMYFLYLYILSRI